MTAKARARLLPGDLLRVGIIGLKMRPLRATLSALGIAIGIASMVAVLGLSESSRAGLIATLDRLGTNLLSVKPGQDIFSGEDAKLPVSARKMIARIGPVQRVSSVASVDATVRRTSHIPETHTAGISVLAADTNLLETLGGRLRGGRFLDAATSRYPTVVLGSVAAQRLGIEDLSGSVRVWIDGQWFTVIGILEPLPLAPDIDRSAIVGFPAAVSRLGSDGSASTIYVRADPEDVDEVRSVLAATANPERPEEVQVSRPSDALAARAAAKTAFRSLFLGLGAVALLVGALGVANVMVISVLERRTEIGLRRALGATRGQVRAQFLAESLLLAGVGGISGVLIGSLVTMIYATSREWAVTLPFAAVGWGIAAAVGAGAIAGVYPAVRAARMSPTEALRSA